MDCLLAHHSLMPCPHLHLVACLSLLCPPLGLLPLGPLDLPRCPHQRQGCTPRPQEDTHQPRESKPQLQGYTDVKASTVRQEVEDDVMNSKQRYKEKC